MDVLLLCCGVVLTVFVIPILNWLVPNFNQEQAAVQRAINLTRSELEFSRLKKGRITLYLSEKVLPKLSKSSLFNLDKLFGSQMKQMVETIGKYESFEEMIASKLTYALIATVPILVISVVFNTMYIAIPIFFLIFFIKGIRDVKVSFIKVQREITKDLPKLIEKMMMALETGKSFVIVFRELEKSSGPRMKKMLNRLNSNLQDMDHAAAIEIFARETTIPVMLQFSNAVKIGINSGYEDAKDHFNDIRHEIIELRQTALVEITRSRPERVKLLQFAIISFSVLAVLICFIKLFSDVGSIF